MLRKWGAKEYMKLKKWITEAYRDPTKTPGRLLLSFAIL
jgi:hypothetical protein